MTPAKRDRAADNPVGWLGSLAVTYRLGPVEYEYTAEGPQHAPIFTCIASLAGHTSRQSSSSKNQARVGAAETLVQVLLAAAGTNSTMDQGAGKSEVADSDTDADGGRGSGR